MKIHYISLHNSRTWNFLKHTWDKGSMACESRLPSVLVDLGAMFAWPPERDGMNLFG